MLAKKHAKPLPKKVWINFLLMKLRETLTNNGERGDYLNVPTGVSIYPNNTGFFLFGWLSAIVACVSPVSLPCLSNTGGLNLSLVLNVA